MAEGTAERPVDHPVRPGAAQVHPIAGIPLPRTGQQRVRQRRRELAGRRAGRALVAVGAVLVLGAVVHGVVGLVRDGPQWSDLDGLANLAPGLVFAVVGVDLERTHRRELAAMSPGAAARWSTVATVSPGTAFELRCGGSGARPGRGLLQLDTAMRWQPDPTSEADGYREWELQPGDVVEAEVSGGGRLGRLRLVRPSQAFPVVLDVRSTAGLADALRTAGLPVAD